MKNNKNLKKMATYKKVSDFLDEDLAVIIKLSKKLFITWKLNSKKFFHTINHLKKDQIIGLMDGTYEVVKKLFIFDNFFYSRKGLFIYEDTAMKLIRYTYRTPKEYESIENIDVYFDLDSDMTNSEIIKKLGGEEKAKANAVTMDQIEQLIKNQWYADKAGILLDCNLLNLFFILGENSQLIAVTVRSQPYWNVYAYELKEHKGIWYSGTRVIGNKPIFS